MAKNLFLSQPWYDSLGHLVNHLGEDQFLPLLASILQQITAFDHTVIIAYPDGKRPIHIYNDLPEQQVGPSLENYLKGAYLLDPFYSACQDHLAEGYYRLRKLAPDEFYKSEYYRSYYEGTFLKDEVGILVEITRSLRVIISLGIRGPEKTISGADLAFLSVTLPLLNSLCRRHWSDLNLTSSTDYRQREEESRLGEPLDLAFQNFGRDHLSNRECEIVHLVLKGHSSKSIADLLNISTDTVKVHRKHVHTKLNISSHAELFSLFLNAISLVQIGSVDDPLNIYYATRTT